MVPLIVVEDAIEIKYDSKVSEYTVISACREKMNKKKKGPWKISSVVIIDAIRNMEIPQEKAVKKVYGFWRSRSRADDRRLSPVKTRGRHSALDRERSFSMDPKGVYCPPVREESVSIRRRVLENTPLLPPLPPPPQPLRSRSFSFRTSSKESRTRSKEPRTLSTITESSIGRRKGGRVDIHKPSESGTVPAQRKTLRSRSFNLRRSRSEDHHSRPPLRESSIHRRHLTGTASKNKPPLPDAIPRRSRSFRILPLAPKRR